MCGFLGIFLNPSTLKSFQLCMFFFFFFGNTDTLGLWFSLWPWRRGKLISLKWHVRGFLFLPFHGLADWRSLGSSSLSGDQSTVTEGWPVTKSKGLPDPHRSLGPHLPPWGHKKTWEAYISPHTLTIHKKGKVRLSKCIPPTELCGLLFSFQWSQEIQNQSPSPKYNNLSVFYLR